MPAASSGGSPEHPHFWQNGCKSKGSHVPLRFCNSLVQLTELGKTLYLPFLHYNNRYNSDSSQIYKIGSPKYSILINLCSKMSLCFLIFCYIIFPFQFQIIIWHKYHVNILEINFNFHNKIKSYVSICLFCSHTPRFKKKSSFPLSYQLWSYLSATLKIFDLGFTSISRSYWHQQKWV